MHLGCHMDFLVYIVSVFHILLFCNIVFDYIERVLPLGLEKDNLVDKSQILTTEDDSRTY
jgi:hypothetical protein